MANKNTWGAQDIVRQYSLQRQLQKPEETILNIFKSELRYLKMLDIGVGSGRTTHHFANLTKEYIGIDYSENMIKACQKIFKNSSKTISFKICDARSMKNFDNNCFDFIL